MLVFMTAIFLGHRFSIRTEKAESFAIIVRRIHIKHFHLYTINRNI